MIKIDIKVGKRHFCIKDINNKFTFIQGNSGTGKTTLYETIRNKRNYGSIYRERISVENDVNDLPEFNFDLAPHEVTDLISDYEYSLDDYENHLNRKGNRVYIIDEGHPLLHIHGYEEMLNQIESYFIIITRDVTTFKNIAFSPSNILHANYDGKSTIYSSAFSQYESVESIYNNLLKH